MTRFWNGRWDGPLDGVVIVAVLVVLPALVLVLLRWLVVVKRWLTSTGHK